MRRALLLLLLLLSIQLGCDGSFLIGDNPSRPEAPSGPTEAMLGQSCTYRSRATDRDGQSVSIQFGANYSTLTPWSDPVPSGSYASGTITWRNPGTFNLAAQAKNEDGWMSYWSDPLIVTVTNAAPFRPEPPSGPTSTDPGVQCRYLVTCYEPGGESIFIRVVWGDGDSAGWAGPFGSGSPAAFTHTWREFGDYAVLAQARDIHNAHSGWSGTTLVSVGAVTGVHYGTGGRVYSSPAIGTDGAVYFGSSDNCFYAVDSTGTLRWRYSTGGAIYCSPAIASDGSVCIGSHDRFLYCFDPTGTLRWQFETESYVWAAPAVTGDGTVYAASGRTLYAIAHDGRELWRFQAGDWLPSGPSVGPDGTIYLPSADGLLYAVNPDGTPKWQCRLAGPVHHSSPAIGGDGTVYVGCSPHYLYAVASDGMVRWRLRTRGWPQTSPAIGVDGTIYIGADSLLLAVTSWGTQRWRKRLGLGLTSSPAVAADGTVYIGSSEGYINAIAADGTLKWRRRTGDCVGSSPGIGTDGKVYFGSDDGGIYCLRGSSPLAPSPWPKFRRDAANTGCAAVAPRSPGTRPQTRTPRPPR